MRLLAAIAVASLPTVATPIPNPVAMPTKLDPAGQARARALLQELVEIPSVKGRDEVPKVANAVAAELRAAGIAESDIRIIPYEGLPGDQTAALIARWRAPHATRKPLLLIGHMDVVDAKREDWKYDPFKLREAGRVEICHRIDHFDRIGQARAFQNDQFRPIVPDELRDPP